MHHEYSRFIPFSVFVAPLGIQPVLVLASAQKDPRGIQLLGLE